MPSTRRIIALALFILAICSFALPFADMTAVPPALAKVDQNYISPLVMEEAPYGRPVIGQSGFSVALSQDLSGLSSTSRKSFVKALEVSVQLGTYIHFNFYLCFSLACLILGAVLLLLPRLRAMLSFLLSFLSALFVLFFILQQYGYTVDITRYGFLYNHIRCGVYVAMGFSLVTAGLCLADAILSRKKRLSETKTLLKKGRFFKKLRRQHQLMVLSVPFVLFILVNNYYPLWGWTYAFFQADPTTFGLNLSAFQGMNNFENVISRPAFFNAVRNTLAISSLKLVFGYCSTILLALILNEVRIKWFKRGVQTISYLPHFVSWVVAATLVINILSPSEGILGKFLMALRGGSNKSVLLENNPTFYFIVALSELWKEIGWGAIIYLAALTGVDHGLYEAAAIEGAGRFRRIVSISIPSIMPPIKILMILSLGSLLSAGFEQILLLQRTVTIDFSETLDTFIYNLVWGDVKGSDLKKSIPQGTAAGIMNSLVAFILVFSANRVSAAIDGERLF